MVNRLNKEIMSHKSVRIASMNILNNEDKFVEYRFPELIKELIRIDADVLLLQEVLLGQRARLTQALSELGYSCSYFADYITDKKHPERQAGNAIFSRIEGTTFSQLAFEEIPNANFNVLNSVIASFTVHGVEFHASSNHLCWGGGNERYRLSQTKQLTKHAAKIKAKNPAAVIVLGGDFNTQDDSDSIRYLKGVAASEEDDFKGRDIWIDAWDTMGSESNYVTSKGSDYWGSMTAKNVGIRIPELLPARRIDYLFSFGWVYGRNGCPVSFGRFADSGAGDATEISDHYGIYADYLILNQ